MTMQRTTPGSDGSLFGIIADSSNHPMLELNAELRIVWVNAAFLKMTRFTPEEIKQKSIFTLLSSTEERSLRCCFQYVIDERETKQFELLQRTHSGKELWVSVEIQCIRNSQDEIQSFWLIETDVTESKQREDRIHRALDTQQALLNHAGFAIVITDANGLINRFNPAAEKLLGYRADELIDSRMILDLFDRHELARRFPATETDPIFCFDRITDEARLHGSHECEIKWLSRCGEAIPLLLSISAIGEFGQAVSGFIFLAIDLRERQRLESQIAHFQRMESIGQLAAGVAHEINTPMQYVSDNLEFLTTCIGVVSEVIHAYESQLSNGELTWEERQREMQLIYQQSGYPRLRELMGSALNDSREGCERVVAIVRAMRELSHPNRGDFERGDLNRVVRSASTVSRNEWKYVADLTLELEENLPPVECRVAEICQVLVNLLVNAGHAITEAIGSDPDCKGAIRVQTSRDSEGVCIRISDTGCGIPDSVKSRIFEPFFTTKPVGKGTGQGLAIAYDLIVNKHHGRLEVEQTSPHGTTFLIYLPLQQTNSLPTHLQPSASVDANEADLIW